MLPFLFRLVFVLLFLRFIGAPFFSLGFIDAKGVSFLEKGGGIKKGETHVCSVNRLPFFNEFWLFVLTRKSCLQRTMIVSISGAPLYTRGLDRGVPQLSPSVSEIHSWSAFDAVPNI